MNGTDGPTIEFMETTMIGSRTRVVAIKVPLVDKTRLIASRTNDSSQRGIFWQKIGTTNDGCITTRIDFQPRHTTSIALVVANTRITCVATSHQRTTRG